jgi:SAM-dependent methyltransferase
VQADETAVPAELRAGAAGVLRHEAIPFVSYPYEWPFSMLKDAALLQLSLLDEAIGEGLMLKDSSPYNVQWRGTNPVFIDIGSFEKLREGEPWAGYRQFCMLFLYPLLLQAYRGIEYAPLLRGAIDGISPVQARRMFSARDLLRRGVLTHVALHARLERRYADSSKDVKGELRKAGFKTELIRANVRGLTRLIERLEWQPGATAWTGYGTQNTYTDADADRKAAFVREAASSRRRRLVWDIGANDGRYTRIAAEHSDHALAIDADQAVVDALYRSLREEGTKTILPLVMNIADPSPGLGWRGKERKPLPERGTPDLTLCLALVHHVVIGANIPMREFLDWLRELGTELVIEFPTPEDPMAARLLARKREGTHDDYTQESFERALSEAFEVERSERLESGTRVLYRARPRV